MTNNERDTKFQGFAKLLCDDMFHNFVVMTTERRHFMEAAMPIFERIIAQRAYDLAVHILEYAQDDVYYNPHSLIAQGMIPDLTQWPEYHEPRLFEPDTWSFNQPTEQER